MSNYRSFIFFRIPTFRDLSWIKSINLVDQYEYRDAFPVIEKISLVLFFDLIKKNH